MTSTSTNTDKLISTNESSISYERSLEYWADIPPTVDGVLGGFGFISKVDIDGSEKFLHSLLTSKNAPSSGVALDCGAGIGRITKFLLTHHFEEVDIVEPDEKFITSIKEFVGELSSRICNLYQVGLQEFIPVRKYDVIWNQWVLGYLTDVDLVSYLNRCKNALNNDGVIIVKENVTSSGKSETDETDSSVTRSLKQFISIFKQCKLKRVKQCKQTNFPNGIYPVYMFALVPEPDNETITLESLEKLNWMPDGLASASRRIGLVMNLDKTKVMINCHIDPIPLVVHGHLLKIVSEYI